MIPDPRWRIAGEMIRNASSALAPLRDALALLRGDAVPVAPRSVALAHALGRIAAGSVVATDAVPATRVALRDGYAVEAAAVGGASPYNPILLARAPPWVEAGETLPDGSDAVLPPEGWEDGLVTADVAASDGVRACGGEIAAGEVLVGAGARLGALDLMGLEAAGLKTVDIRMPRLRVVALDRPDRTVLSSLIVRLIESHGGTAESVAAGHDVAEIADAVAGGVADAVFVLGGSGFGRTDHGAAAIARAGKVRAHGIAVRPGDTAAVGTAAGRPVLLLPGRPEAALAVFQTLGRPLLAALAGAPDGKPRPARVLRKVVSAIGLSDVVFVRTHPDGIEPLGGSELPLGRLLQADGFVLVAPGFEGFPAGENVEVWPL